MDDLHETYSTLCCSVILNLWIINIMVAKNLEAQLVGTSWCLQWKYPRFRSPHQNYWIMKNKPHSEGNFCGQSEFWKYSRYNLEFVNHKAIYDGKFVSFKVYNFIWRGILQSTSEIIWKYSVYVNTTFEKDWRDVKLSTRQKR